MGKITDTLSRTLGYGFFFGLVGPPMGAFFQGVLLTLAAYSVGKGGTAYLEMIPLQMLLSYFVAFFPAFATGLVCGAMRGRFSPAAINIVISIFSLFASFFLLGLFSSGPIRFSVSSGPMLFIFVAAPIAAVLAHHWAVWVAEASSWPASAIRRDVG